MALSENMVVWEGLNSWLSKIDLSLLQKVGSLDQRIVHDPQFLQKYCTSSVFEILPDKQYRLCDYSLANVVEDIHKYQVMPTWLRAIRQTWFGTSRLIPNFEMFSFTLVCVQLAAHIHRFSGIEKILSPLNSDFDKAIKETPLNEQHPCWVLLRKSQAGNGSLQAGMNKTIKVVAEALRYQLIKREYEQNVKKHEQRNFISRFFFEFFTNIKSQKRWLAQANQYFKEPLLEVFPMRRMADISLADAPLNSNSSSSLLDGNSQLSADFTSMIEQAMKEYPNNNLLDDKDKKEVVIIGGARTEQQIKILYSHICEEYQKWRKSKQNDLSPEQGDFLYNQVMHWLREYDEKVVEIFGYMTKINSQYHELLHSNKEISQDDITYFQQLCKDFVKGITQRFGRNPMFKSLIIHLRETAKSWINSLKRHQSVRVSNSDSTMPTQVTNRWFTSRAQKSEARGDFWRKAQQYYVNLFSQWGEGRGFRPCDIQSIKNELQKQKENIPKLEKLDNLAEMGMSSQQKQLHYKYKQWRQHYKRVDDLLKGMAEIRQLIDEFFKIFPSYEADISSITSSEKVDRLLTNQQLAVDAEVERIIYEHFSDRPDDAAILQRYGEAEKRNLADFIKNNEREAQKKAVLDIKAMFDKPDEDLFTGMRNWRYRNHIYAALMQGMQKLKQKATDILTGFPAAASAIPEDQRAFKVRELTDQSAMVIQESQKIISEFLSDLPEDILTIFDQYANEQQFLLRMAMYNYIFRHWEILEIPRAWLKVLEGKGQWDKNATVQVSKDMLEDLKILKLPHQINDMLSCSALSEAFIARVRKIRPDKINARAEETSESASLLAANERLRQKLQSATKPTPKEQERVKREVEFLENIIYMHTKEKKYLEESEKSEQIDAEIRRAPEKLRVESERAEELLDKHQEELQKQGDKFISEMEVQFKQLGDRLDQLMNDRINKDRKGKHKEMSEHQEGNYMEMSEHHEEIAGTRISLTR
jgi:hypothetical protein